MPEEMSAVASNPAQTMKRLFNHVMKLYKFHMLGVIICIIISVICNAQGTMFMKTLIDDHIVPLVASSKPNYSGLAGAIRDVAVFYTIGVVSMFLSERLMVYIGKGTLRDIRKELFDHMERLPVKYFDTHSHGDIMSIYTNDVDTLSQIIAQGIPQIVDCVLSIITALVCMITLSIPLTLATIIVVVVMMIVTGKVGGQSGNYFMKRQNNIGAMDGYIEEMISGQKVVKIFGHENECKEGFKQLNEQLFESDYQAEKFASMIGPINTQLGNLSYVICVVVGGLLALNGIGTLTLGKLTSFLTFNKNFNMPIIQISMIFNAVVMSFAGAQRVFGLLDEEIEADDGYVTLVVAEEKNGKLVESNKEYTGKWAWKHLHQDTGETTYVPLLGNVVFDGVDFGYDDEKMVLHDIKLEAKPGQKIALVGSTGAGKTTITNLINRFYDIQDGKIRYDGININKIKKADLRRSLGIVLQDTHLFTTTVKENIRYGNLDATDEQIKEAARLSNAHSFIKHLSDGYDTLLQGEGSSLSQGQRQLLAIARAAVANPPVLILDEATSSIDTRTERLVQDGMDKLMEGRTTFVIAHRLSTVRNSDCIIVLEHGRIIEMGNHEELIQRKGKYYQLYTGMAA